ncbi:MAG: tetratricopeptide repeat protein [Minicystis sp.]
MRYELKRLPEMSLESALAKAEHYRDLNQPDEAESICRDVLDIDPAHQMALRTLGLALTDRFPHDRHRVFDEAIAAFQKLTSEYERAYYTGIAWERLAKVQLEQGETRNAVHAFEKALELFDRAESLGDGKTPDPILRWNRCVRAVKNHPDLISEQKPRVGTTFQFDD